jgi:hypothetical protein
MTYDRFDCSRLVPDSGGVDGRRYIGLIEFISGVRRKFGNRFDFVRMLRIVDRTTAVVWFAAWSSRTLGFNICPLWDL